MAESVSANSQTETSPVTGPSSFGSAVVDTQGLQTVHELPRNTPTYNGNGSLDNRLLAKSLPPADLRDASPDSFFRRNYSEKQLEAAFPQRFRHTTPAPAVPEEWQRARDPSASLRNGNRRDTKRESTLMQNTPKKERKVGFRNTLRRMFTRRSTRDRISMPDPTVYPRHVSSLNHSPRSTTLTPRQGPRRIHYLSNRCSSKALRLCTDQWRPPYKWARISSTISKGAQPRWCYKQSSCER